MIFIPRSYQNLAIDFMADNPRCGLFAQPGLGKTSSALEVLCRLAMTEDPFPALIVAPKRVARKTWREEIGKWDSFGHLRISQIVGNPAQRLLALGAAADIYTINYENLPWLLKQLDGKMPYRSILPDESSRAKNFRASFQRSSLGEVFLRVSNGKYIGALARMAFHSNVKHFIEMTGTPSPNGLGNLWGQLFLIDRGERLGGSFDAFQQRWFRPHPSGYGVEPLPHAQAEIQERIQDICLTINAADWFDLKEPVHTVIEVELPAAVRTMYKEMEKRFYFEIRDVGIEAFNSAAKSNKLLQLASGAVYDNEKVWHHVHDEKIEALRDLIEECNGAPMIIAYQFKHELERLRQAFPEGCKLETERDEDDFRVGKISLLFMHPASAGHGLDGMQHVCNVIVFYGHWWDLELREQIIARIGPVRQMQAGLDKACFVYDIVATGTVDEVVLERHRTKGAVQELLMAALTRKYGRGK